MMKKDASKLTKRFLRNPKDRRENVSMSDGINLGLGTAEYKELRRDRAGIDEIAQEKLKLKNAGLRPSDSDKDYNNVDEDHLERREKLATEPLAREVKRESRDNKRLSTTKRVVSNQVLKSADSERIVDKMAEQAAQTETKEDDKFVKRRLPKVLAKDIYNEGVSRDEFYPGQSTLEKYM